jgi:hypothetical protein
MVQPLYGFASGDPLRFRRALGHSDLFYVEDRDLEFKEVIEKGDDLPYASRCPFSIQFSFLHTNASLSLSLSPFHFKASFDYVMCPVPLA